jgi:two-component system, NarL family, response regulator LiaR
MKKTVLIYSFLLALIVVVLKILEYRYFLRDLSLEIYLAIIALIFTAIGIWAGLRIVDKKTRVPVQNKNDKPDAGMIKKIGISEREHEVLTLMATGLSNQEIADRLYVSLPTIKTHNSNIYSKLGVQRRTQAIQKARNLNII